MQSETDWQSVRQEAYREMTISSPLYHSTTANEEQVFEGDYTPTALTTLAIFSDDGADVYVNGTKVFPASGQTDGGKGQLQALDLSALHRINVALKANTTYHIKIDYTNIIYTGSGDIDGCTLFMWTIPSQLIGPVNVPGLSQYTYNLLPLAGTTSTSILWSVDNPTGQISGSSSQSSAVISFSNAAAVVGVKATYTVNGVTTTASTDVAVVQLAMNFMPSSEPGKEGLTTSTTGSGPAGISSVWAKPSGTPDVSSHYVTSYNPGSRYDAFVPDNTVVPQTAEAENNVDSDSAHPSNPQAFVSHTGITLTPPLNASIPRLNRPNAVTHIEVGYVQKAYDSGGATYSGTSSTRNIWEPTTDTVDWYQAPTKTNPDSGTWPWYDNTSTSTPGVYSTPASSPLELSDAPQTFFPQYSHPNDATGNYTSHTLVGSAEPMTFLIYIAARTKDSDNDAEANYFAQASNSWVAHFAWPVINQNIVNSPNTWVLSSNSTALSVNVLPFVTDINPPYKSWIPSP